MGKKKKGGIETERETNNGKINRALNLPPQEAVFEPSQVGHRRKPVRETFPLHSHIQRRDRPSSVSSSFYNYVSLLEFRLPPLTCVATVASFGNWMTRYDWASSWFILLAFTILVEQLRWRCSAAGLDLCVLYPISCLQSFANLTHFKLQVQEMMIWLRSEPSVQMIFVKASVWT